MTDIRHQNEHLSGRMTDISIMDEWLVAGVGGTRPFWDVLGEALEGRFSFEARISLFFSRVKLISKSSFVPALFKDLAPNVRALGLLVSTMSWNSFWNSAWTPGIFCKLRLRPRVVFWKFPFVFQSKAGLTAGLSRAGLYLPDSNGDLHAEQSIFVMVRRKVEFYFQALPRWGGVENVQYATTINYGCCERYVFNAPLQVERRRIIDCRRDWYESLAVIHGSEEKKHKEVNVWLCEVPPFHHPQGQRVLKNLFPRPDVATALHFAVFVYVDVQLLVGQAAARGQRRKAVIRDISGVGHRGATNLTVSIWFTEEKHRTVFRHVMQFSLLVPC